MNLDWNINPLDFFEFFVVVAFGIGLLIIEVVAKRYDRKNDVPPE